MKIITIDGPAGSGKSTVANGLARHMNWMYINTGSLYRALGLILLELNNHKDDHVDSFIAFLAKQYRQDPKTGRVYLGEREITHDLKDQRISEKASSIAENNEIRKQLLPIKRQLAQHFRNAIIDGRDTGTVVFPNAPLKIYLTANPEVRAQRRMLELESMGKKTDFERLLKDMEIRDRRDMERKQAPLVPAEDAIILDSSAMRLEQVIQFILDKAKSKGLFNGNI